MPLKNTVSAASINGWSTNDYVNNPYVFLQTLTPDVPTVNASFGYSIEMSSDGNYLFVGAPDYSSPTPSAGAAYVFYNSSGTWVQQTILQGTGITNSLFGWAISSNTDGSLIAISAQQLGQVFIYSRSGTTWSLQATLTASPSQAGEAFGTSINMDPTGTWLVVGAPNYDLGPDTNRGRAIIYKRTGTTWAQNTILFGDAQAFLSFGYRVVINSTGDFICIATRNTLTSQNRLYYSQYSGGAWSSALILFLDGGYPLTFSNDDRYLLSKAVIYENTAYPSYPGTWISRGNALPLTTSTYGTTPVFTNVIPSISNRYILSFYYLTEGNNSSWSLKTQFTNPSQSTITFVGGNAIDPDGSRFYVGDFGATINGLNNSGGVYIYTKI